MSPDQIIPTIEASKAKLILSSIETISDVTIQKALQHIKVNYVAVDECQVRHVNPIYVMVVSL